MRIATRKWDRRIVLISVMAVALMGVSGCSVYMAAKQPDKKDLGVLSPGTPRSLLLAELGQPVASEERDGRRVDIFTFTQGYGTATKTGRALFHGAADVFTLGLWEVVGTPTEAIFDGDKLSFEVRYDGDEKVDEVVPLRDEAKEALEVASDKGDKVDEVTPLKEEEKTTMEAASGQGPS